MRIKKVRLFHPQSYACVRVCALISGALFFIVHFLSKNLLLNRTIENMNLICDGVDDVSLMKSIAMIYARVIDSWLDGCVSVWRPKFCPFVFWLCEENVTGLTKFFHTFRMYTEREWVSIVVVDIASSCFAYWYILVQYFDRMQNVFAVKKLSVDQIECSVFCCWKRAPQTSYLNS